MRPSGWSLTKYDWSPYKKRKRHKGFSCSQEKSSEDTERKWSLANGENKKKPDLLPP